MLVDSGHSEWLQHFDQLHWSHGRKSIIFFEKAKLVEASFFPVVARRVTNPLTSEATLKRHKM